MKKILPWWVKVLVKIGISRLPVPYSFWKKIKLFEHGDMQLPSRALDTFLMHAKTAGVLDDRGRFSSSARGSGKDFHVLEIGPGDSLYGGLIAKTLGASRTWLVDTGNYAESNVASYKNMADYLKEQGYATVDLVNIHELVDYLKVTNTDYLVEGVDSLKKIPSASIDYCFSNAVLEHVECEEFELFIRELKRVLKPQSRSCHRVDLKDHLGGGLNNLRFPRKIWESNLFKSSGFYTNRIRFGEYRKLFSQVGFVVDYSRVVKWDDLPIKRQDMDIEFRSLPVDDLLVSGFDMVLTLDIDG